MFSALYYYFGAGAINRFFGLKDRFYAVDFRNWGQCANANVSLLLLLSFSLAGLILLAAGAVRILRGKEAKQA